ncbi:T6SS effector BTH_I2691 family protein [Lelliottia wanjuensis]|uniref:T6SS effector BTH_I2691 family protein n=2 Tax=Lelliottia wanjuensis TaxID=3050585 RepID=UPI00254C69B8|nr:T6SS effector BTH_I2691 family protein [Lelliottia sp. V86_10]MDK9583880.1 T6SS effector BTH_I2691 family protein [Lelliottia sp. V86_10]
MGIKDQVGQNTAATQQAASTPSGCKVCQRQGIPVFPLRVAAVPKAVVSTGWKSRVPEQDVALTGGEFKYALRTLRMGYLYVLLDKTVWQGYMVTAEGYLRYFNPLEKPEGETVEPITEACRQQGHCINASFINIDVNPATGQDYEQAWLAFSGDAWSKEVLNEYQSGKRPASRFTQISLSTLKKSPASIPEARVLDMSLSALTPDVAEFATELFGNVQTITGEPNGGAHGFYPRQGDKAALGARVVTLTAQYGCPISALILEDAVGVVQELNIGRLQVVEARQIYNELPVIRHKHMISEAIKQYLDSLKKTIDANSKPRHHEATPSGYPAAGGVTISAEQVAFETYAEKVARLSEYYKEPERAEFAQQYQQQQEDYQKRIAAIGKDLAVWYQSQKWLALLTDDYAPEPCPQSWAARLSTVASCIQGGCTDDETEKVWLDWLQDPTSPAYQGILGNIPSVSEAIYSGTAGYTNLKVVLGSKEVSDLIDSKRVQQATAHIALAMSGGVSRLTTRLARSAQDGYSRVVQGVIYLASRQKVTVFTLDMTVHQYQTLSRNIARAQLTATGKPAQFSGELQNGKRLKRSLSGGSFLQITDPKILEQRIAVTLVSEMDPEKFASHWEAGPIKGVPDFSSFAELRISAVTLEGAASKSIRLLPKQVQQVLDEQVQLSRRLVSSNTMGGLLGGGMLFLQVGALAGNMQAVMDAIGHEVDAQIVLLSNMTMVASSAVETSGFVHMLVRANPWDLAPNVIVKGVPEYVHPLIRMGGVLAGVSAIFDGVGMIVKAYTSSKKGDTEASIWYSTAGVATGIGGGVAIYAALACQFALLGPAGIAAVLIVAGAMMAIQAANAVSSAFEVWLRCGCFGVESKRGDNDRIWNVSVLEDLSDALMAYEVIVSGMEAEVDYQDIIGEIANDEDVIKMRVRLPCCNGTLSAWDLKLTAKGSGGSVQLLSSRYPISGSADTPVSPGDGSSLPRHPRHPNYPLNNTLTERWDGNSLVLEGEAWVTPSRYNFASLSVDYWTDRDDPECQMILNLTVAD